MAENTPNLELYKKQMPDDASDKFNITTMLNENWDKIDAEFHGATGHGHTGAAGDGPKLGADGLAGGAATDAVIGNRTIDDTVAAAGGADTPTRLWSKLANMVKAITGKSSWFTAPAASLETLNTRTGDASTSAKGIVQLEDSTSSTSTTRAATAAAVKAAKDAADAAWGEVGAHRAESTPHTTIQGVDKFGLTAAVSISISNGAIDVTRSFHIVTTEGSAANDDLNTINGGAVGDILLLKQAADNADITIKNGTGNIYTWDGRDIVMDTSGSALMLFKTNSGVWIVVGIQGVKRSGDSMSGSLEMNNGGQIAPPIHFLSTTRNCWIDNQNGMFRLVDRDALSQRFGIHVQTGDITILSGSSVTIKAGNGVPEGTITAPVGSLYLRRDLSGVSCLYIKESGAGNTGWMAK